MLAEQLWGVAGIRLHGGKTRVWNRASECPPGMDDLGNEVWNAEGIKVLGTPVGSPQFVQHTVDTRLEEEKKLWEAISWVPDLQSAWQILLQCAGPVATMFSERCPPSQSTHYAAEHDEGMLKVLSTLLGGIPGGDQEKEDARRLATLPMRMGGLGLRSAARMAPAAYWASWADALPMVHERLSGVAENAVIALEGDDELEGCLGELRVAAVGLDRQGFVGRP